MKNQQLQQRLIQVTGGDLSDLPALINEGADLEINLSPREGEKYTALMRAAKYGRVEVVNALLNAGADPNATDHYSGKTVASYAMDYQVMVKDSTASNKIHSLLKLYKSSPDEQLHSAIKNGDINHLQSLIRRGVDINKKRRYLHSVYADGKRTYYNRATPIMVAANLGKHEIAGVLLAAGATLDKRVTALLEGGRATALEASIFREVLAEHNEDKQFRANTALEALDNLLPDVLENMIGQYIAGDSYKKEEQTVVPPMEKQQVQQHSTNAFSTSLTNWNICGMNCTSLIITGITSITALFLSFIAGRYMGNEMMR